MKRSWEMRITFVLVWASIFLSFSPHSQSMGLGSSNVDDDEQGDEGSVENENSAHNDTTTTTISRSAKFDEQHHTPTSEEAEAFMKTLDEKSSLLVKINDISSGIMGDLCTMKKFEVLEGVNVSTKFAKLPMEKVDLIVAFLYKLMEGKSFPTTPDEKGEFEDVFEYVLGTLETDKVIKSVRLLIYIDGQSRQFYFVPGTNKTVKRNFYQEQDLKQKPWFYHPKGGTDGRFATSSSNVVIDVGHSHPSRIDKNLLITSKWTWPYFNCSNPSIDTNRDIKSDEDVYDSGRWLASYTAWFPINPSKTNRDYTQFGELSFDVDLSHFDINQCGFEMGETGEKEKREDEEINPLHHFRDTHKCDRISKTSKCFFLKGSGWRLGSYECRCCNNTYAYNRTLNNTINGTFAEVAWDTWRKHKVNENDSVMYPTVVSCKQCPEGCDNCVDGVSCLAPMNWMFRLTLLCVSIICSVGSVGLVILTFKFRKLPIFKTSSPTFHCITLLGCMIMYSEMLALFPVLNQAYCVAVKWTRHLGFSITYTALYMKLCRVYLTFRVKSAHKIKLTEKHLLHWMSPIMVIMLLYLFAWTISDPPSAEFMYTTDNLKFHQCVYNWWDHALAIGEVIFLTYGVWICWRIRENPDAQFISYSIYNIAFVNVLMVSLHLLIVPKAGPDMKYLLAFLRTQMSTTVTIAFVFGSKLCSVLRGDASALKEIPNSANGFGHETLDLGEENQQLKEELQKMATQIERLKSYAMCKNNPHLKQSSANISNADIDLNHLESFTTL